jgi:hypothetical protein
MMVESGHQVRIHGSREGMRSNALKWRGTKDSIDAPDMTPSPYPPRDNPSVPWAIILLPDTCITCSLILPVISRTLRRRMRWKSNLLGELPL